MRILQLRKWLSAHDDNGGKLRATGLARALSHFAEVDAVGFANDSNTTLRQAAPLAHYRRLYPVAPEPLTARALQLGLQLGRGRSLRSARFCSAAYQRHVSAALSANHYDAIQVEELSILPNLATAAARVPIIYSAHNVESALALQLLRSRGNWFAALAHLEKRRTAAEERHALRTARFCLTVSDADKVALERLQSHGHCPIHVVPNCADDALVPAPASVAAAEQPHQVVFIACFGWQPNAEATRWFLGQVLPHLRRGPSPCAIHFVGSGITPALAATIRAAGCVADADVPDIRPHLHRARVAMVPLLSGSGTRLKIVEAWAAGVPVVSTALGAAGLACTDGTDILLASEPAAFAAALSRLLADDGIYERLRANGLRRAASLRWAQQAPGLETLYGSLS